MAVASAAIVALVAAIASAAATWIWMGWARRHSVMDFPAGRRIHLAPTPRGGGVGIALILALAGFAAASLSVPAGVWPVSWTAWSLAVGAIAVVGLWDDLRPLPAAGKLAGQAAGVLAISALLATAFGLDAWSFAGLSLAGLYLVNAWNFMDGSDALVASQTALLAIVLWAWPGQAASAAWIAAALAGACLGFLAFNLPPARVFLGDVGSHATGAAIFGLLAFDLASGTMSLPQVLLLCSAFVLDTGWTLARRLVAGKTLWRAHREHAYQWARRRGNSPLAVCLAFALWTTMACVVALATTRRPAWSWPAAVLVLSIGSALMAGLRHRWLRRSSIAGYKHS